MIDAKEARRITDTARARVDLVLKQVDHLVRQTAPNTNSVFLHVDGLYESRPVHTRVAQTTLQAAVIAELKSLGYEVVLGPNSGWCGPPDKPPSPLYIDYGITIRW